MKLNICSISVLALAAIATTMTGEAPAADVPQVDLAEWTPPERNFPRGYNRLFADHIRQADQGCDFDFLEGTAPTPEPEIH